MSRLRRSNKQVLEELETSNGLIDSEDQDQLVTHFEMELANNNKFYTNIFTVLYLVPLGVYFSINKIPQYRNLQLNFMCINSLILSVLHLRYDLRFVLETGSVELVLNNMTLCGINLALSLLPVWVKTRFIVYWIPAVLFGVAVVLKNWMRSMDNDIHELNELKYKYKSA